MLSLIGEYRTLHGRPTLREREMPIYRSRHVIRQVKYILIIHIRFTTMKPRNKYGTPEINESGIDQWTQGVNSCQVRVHNALGNIQIQSATKIIFGRIKLLHGLSAE